MQEHQSVRQFTTQTFITDANTDERLLAALEEIAFCLEQIESWRDLVERQNQVLQATEQELRETQQELEFTNNDLYNALIKEKLELDQAQALASQMLASNDFTSKSLARLLTTIYKSKIKPADLEQLGELNPKDLSVVGSKIFTNSKQLRNHSKELREQYKELGFKFVVLKAHVREMNEQLDKMRKYGVLIIQSKDSSPSNTHITITKANTSNL